MMDERISIRIIGFTILLFFPAIAFFIIDKIFASEFFLLYRPILNIGVLIILYTIFSLYELSAYFYRLRKEE